MKSSRTFSVDNDTYQRFRRMFGKEANNIIQRAMEASLGSSNKVKSAEHYEQQIKEQEQAIQDAQIAKQNLEEQYQTMYSEDKRQRAMDKIKKAKFGLKLIEDMN